MEQVNTIILNNKSIYPNDEVLKPILGKSFLAYCKLLELFENNNMTYDWRYYKDGKAWLCKVEKKNETIVWMSVWKGYIQATIYFAEKYIDGLYELNIANELKVQINGTKNVGISKPCMFKILNKKVLKDFNAVMQYKLILR